MKRIIILLLLAINLNVSAQTLPGFQEYTYKETDSTSLSLYIIKANAKNVKGGKPTIVFFFGGGWTSGKVTQFQPHAEYFASRGMTTVLADYRIKNRNNTTPFDAVADAKSVMRYLRQHAAELNIDTAKIVAAGGSAGGHLAAATATLLGLNDANDNLRISAIPNALILFNPVIDSGPNGYGYKQFGDRYKEISPIHNITKGNPPTIVFQGTKDDLIPVSTADDYKKKMEEIGNRCDLFLYENQKHGFFNYRQETNDGNKYYIETVYQADLFLKSIGFLEGNPTIK